MNAEGQRALWNSIYTGLIGYLAVAVFFLVLDPLLGRGFLHTPALLGSALFYGLTDPAALTIQPGPIIAYNGAHLVVFLVLGLVVGELTYASVRLRQQAWYLVSMLVILVLGHLYVALWVLTQPVRSALPVWMITVAGLVAVAAMVACLLVLYPQLRRELVQRDAGS
jgi:uncharacterized membrane protein YqjE